MQRIRYLKIIFENQIDRWEVPALRGAIIAKVLGKHEDTSMFHHHGDKGFIYDYPLIQYKQIGGKASIICLKEGVDEIHKFFENKSWNIQISSREIPLKVEDLKLGVTTFQVWNSSFEYRISNWLALNEKNHKVYKDLKTDVEKKTFLSRILTGNILSLAKGIDWHVDQPIITEFVHIQWEAPITFKGTKLWAISGKFKCNVSLPSHIGLGKSSSQGFGIVTKVQREKEQHVDN